jgi:hypothetical protein
MDLVNLFIAPDFSCNKSSYSLREDSLLQIFKLTYKFFNPFISNGKLMINPQDLLAAATWSPTACGVCALMSHSIACEKKPASLNETIKYDRHLL